MENTVTTEVGGRITYDQSLLGEPMYVTRLEEFDLRMDGRYAESSDGEPGRIGLFYGGEEGLRKVYLKD